jgi:hypothetical protein
MTFSFEFFHQQMGAICRPGQLWKAFKKTANGRNPLSNMIIQVKFDKVFLAPSPPGTPAHVFNAHIYMRLDVAAILQWRTPTHLLTRSTVESIRENSKRSQSSLQHDYSSQV